MFKTHFSEFVNAHRGVSHFTAHSHHFWPNITRQAMDAYWLDSMRLSDNKWEKILGEIVPEAQHHIAAHLHLNYPQWITFAPNTHELVYRVLSSIETDSPIRILTTDSEFYSFDRQARRLEETGQVVVTRIPVFPYETFEERFVQTSTQQAFHLIYFSQTFFNSGFRISNLDRLVGQLPSDSLVMIDGYHGFFAVPTDLSTIQNRVFYLGGGYKYAMSGEGICFMTVPPGSGLRPAQTGWFATFGTLSATQSDWVQYSDDGYRFWGSTFDPSGLYRFNAVNQWMKSIDLTIEGIDRYVRSLMSSFWDRISSTPNLLIDPKNCITPLDPDQSGHFFTFDFEAAKAVMNLLKERKVMVDVRDTRLRFGFGIYQDDQDLDILINRLSK